MPLLLFKQGAIPNIHMVKSLLNKIRSLDEHTLEVVKKSFGATIVKVIGVLASLLVSVFLGRTLGADGLGIIDLTHKTSTLLITFLLLGTTQLLIRDIAIAEQKGDYRKIGLLMGSSFIINGVLTLLVSLLLISIAPYLANKVFEDERITVPLIIALLAMVPMVFSRIFSSGLIGFKKIWQSNLVNQTLSLVLVGLTLATYYLLNIKINIINVAYIYAFCRLLVTICVGAIWLFDYREKSGNVGFLFKNPDFSIIRKSFPFLLISAKAVLFTNVDSIMIGWFSDAYNVGLYSVAAKIALLTSFFLQITNSSLSPKIASMYSENRIVEINKMVQKVTLGLFIIGLFSLGIFLLFGNEVLSIWGSEFKNAEYILIVLAIGQMINIGTGPAGLVLVMCGFEKLQAKIAGFYLLANILLNYFLILKYQAFGAAFATSISIVLENLTKVYFAKKRAGILTFKLGLK